MPLYTEYWKPKLKQLKALLDAGQNPVSIEIDDIKTIGERKDENYPGYANIRFGTEATNTNAQHLRDLCDLITKTTILRPYSNNELRLRITADFQLTANYNVFTNEDLIKVYKSLIVNGNPQEIYKWHTLKTQYWYLDAADLLGMYNKIPFHNLVYHDARRVMQHIMPLYPDEIRSSLKELFNEDDKAPSTRIIEFRNKIETIYRRVEPKLGTHHDERTIATYLTYRYPEKYAFYKESFYSKYCKMLGIAPMAVNKKYIHYLGLVYDFKTRLVDTDKELLALVDRFKDDKCFADNNHLLLSQDILYQTLVGKWEEDNEDELTDKTTIASPDNNDIMPHSLNTILYGPPGTGKTFNTVNKAIEIINPDFLKTPNLTRKQVKEEYDRLVKEGNIQFCTFHQSMSYEDFIEGIKPALIDISNKEESPEETIPIEMKYVIQPGIFKIIAEKARFKPTKEIVGFSIPNEEFEQATFYKMSLGSAQDDEEIYRYCIDNNYIALGWGGYNNFTGKSESEVRGIARSQKLATFETGAIVKFIHHLKNGNLVIISNGNYSFRAIGRVTGEYEYKGDDCPIDYPHFRKVEWLLKDVNIPSGQIYDRQFSMQSIYKLDKSAIKKDFFVKASKQAALSAIAKHENYVLIIDEINRGNISQIFGELITLIEDDKREGEGKTETLSVTLPYSKKPFTVPANLHIIGTMNTADRSVEALDTALRRRFSFQEMATDHTLLSIASAQNDAAYKAAVNANPLQPHTRDLIIGDVNLRLLLNTINRRITALLSNDHIIGHAWLMNVSTETDLKEAFANKILPLLQEYFYNDYSKIGLVLGSRFVKKEEFKTDDFAIFEGDDDLLDSYDDKTMYKIIPSSEWTLDSYRSIYTTK